MPLLRHRLFLLALLIATAAGVSATASAAVQVRLGIQPDTLVHCERGHVAFALWNDGEDPLRVRVFVSIAHDDSTEIGPLAFRASLESHQLFRREADFFVPPMLPVGRYALRVRAVASDSSRAEAIARFVVERSECNIRDGSPTPVSVLLEGLGTSLGLDLSTPTIRSSWGAIKRRYDGTPR